MAWASTGRMTSSQARLRVRRSRVHGSPRASLAARNDNHGRACCMSFRARAAPRTCTTGCAGAAACSRITRRAGVPDCAHGATPRSDRYASAQSPRSCPIMLSTALDCSSKHESSRFTAYATGRLERLRGMHPTRGQGSQYGHTRNIRIPAGASACARRQGCEQVINGHLPVFRRLGHSAVVTGIAQGLHPQGLGFVARNGGLSGNPWQDLWVSLPHFSLLGTPSSSVVKRLAFGLVVRSRDSWPLAAWAGNQTKSVRQRTWRVSAQASRKQALNKRACPRKCPGSRDSIYKHHRSACFGALLRERNRRALTK
jgi:hypothetical protein